MSKLKPDAEAFRRYKGFDTIPLHRYFETQAIKGRQVPLGKRPLDFNWTKRRYNQPGTSVIARCSKEGRNMGWRIPPNALVIDVDPRHGGLEGFEDVAMDYGVDLSRFPKVVTGSGGFHLYGKKPADVSVVDSLATYPGVEFKSAGRQVVCAGSVHPDTKRHYEFSDENPPIEDGLPEFPRALLEAIKRPERSGEAAGGGQYSQDQLAKALAKLDATDFASHDKWLQLMMACHHATNGDGREEFIEWSTTDPAYADDAESIGRRWDSLHTDRDAAVTYRTLNKILADHGAADATQAAGDADEDFEGAEPVEAEGAKTSTALTSVEDQGLRFHPKTNVAFNDITNAYIAVRRSGLNPAWDELKQNIVFTCDRLPWDESFGRVLTDHLVRLVRFYLVRKYQGVNYQPSEENLRSAIMTLAYAAKFNPVVDYLDDLKWDGIERVGKLFGTYFNCGVNAYTEAVSRCFMIGAVRRVRHPGSKFDTMPVLEGPQGWNKSTGVKKLFGAEWFSDSSLGNLRDKDTVMKLRGIWVQEFAEIESLTRAETGVMKNFTATEVDRQRDPYGFIVEERPRRCVFVGTVNQSGYLQDPTGGRRFWPLKLAKRVDIAALERDRDQLWAEAAVLEARGESDVLPERLWPLAGEHQKEQTNVHPWADRIRDFLEGRERDFDRQAFEELASDDIEPLPPDKVHSSELFDFLKIPEDRQTRAMAQRLREVMEQDLGWCHRRGVRIEDKSRAGYVRPEDPSAS